MSLIAVDPLSTYDSVASVVSSYLSASGGLLAEQKVRGYDGVALLGVIDLDFDLTALGGAGC